MTKARLETLWPAARDDSPGGRVRAREVDGGALFAPGGG